MPKSPVKATLEGLDERIVTAMNHYVLSGMAVGVVQDGRLIYGKGFGLAEARSQKPVTCDTAFRIASISKTFTAIAVMQLWEQGKFNLDDPINDHLRAYKVLHPDPAAPAVTIRHLLTHTSGIGEMRDLADLFQGAIFHKNEGEVKPGEPMPSLAEYYRGNLQPDVYPDEKWAYANHAFGTLGQLIEDISGEPFPEYMRNHVLDPLGMHHSDFLLNERVKDELAQGYHLKKGLLKEAEFLSFPEMAAGSLISSVNDVALYLAALMNGGANENGSVIKPETLDMMMKPQYQPDPHLAAMGLGLFLEDLDGHPAIWHGGALDGFNSAIWVAPQDKLAVFVAANSNTRAIYSIAEGFLRNLLGLEDLDKRVPHAEILNSPHLWPEMMGIYGTGRGLNSNARAWLTFGGEVEITTGKKGLRLKSLAGAYKDGIDLYPCDPNDPLAFESVTDGKLTSLVFQRNPEGFIDRLSISSLAFYTFYKKPVTRSVKFWGLLSAGALAGLIAASVIRTLTPKNTGKNSKNRNCCC
jgi:CubicO group peptidase (beta-lactamase class C family)